MAAAKLEMLSLKKPKATVAVEAQEAAGDAGLVVVIQDKLIRGNATDTATPVTVGSELLYLVQG
jgi:hypothetical protein